MECSDTSVLEHVLHIRDAVDGLCDDMREVKERLGLLGNHYANLSNHYCNISNSLDRIDGRIERIEKRLNLTDA